MDEELYIVCILVGAWPQIAPVLGEEYVFRLQEGAQKYAPKHKFICFTDRDPLRLPGVTTRSLPAGIQGWFAKMYLFSKEAFPEGSRVLYFDLDTVILGSLLPLVMVDIAQPVMLWDEYHPLPKRAASGIMAFRSGPELYPIWDEFSFAGYSNACPPYRLRRPHPMINDSVWQQWITAMLNRGGITTDEEWLHYFIYPKKHVLWQDMLADRTVLSYKWDILGFGRRNRKRARAPWTALYFFHGRPRPHEVKEFWDVASSGRRRGDDERLDKAADAERGPLCDAASAP